MDPKVKNSGTPINRFLTKLGVRGRTSIANKDKDVSFKVPHIPNKHKKENLEKLKNKTPPKDRSGSPFNRLVNRLSGRRAKRSESQTCELTNSESSEDPSFAEPDRSEMVAQMHYQTPPRPARSENDLRHVTLTRGSDLPITPLAGASAFISEDNLASTECGTPAHKVPSYIRISSTLYGYNRSPRRNFESTAHSLGQSLVERRLNAFTKMQTPRREADAYSTPTRSSASRSATCTSPNTSFMGAQISAHTPSPIKALIGQFDQFHLCAGKEDSDKDVVTGKENVKPNLVINQPVISDIEKSTHIDREAVSLASLEQPLSLVGTTTHDASEMEHATHEAGISTEEATQIAGGIVAVTVEEESRFAANVIQVKPLHHNRNLKECESHKDENDTQCGSSIMSGKLFRDLLDSKRNELQKKSDLALRELEQIKDLPEGAGDAIRMAAGKAALLIRKKLGKFEELVHKNINPIMDDPQPVTVGDLSGYWAMVEIELEDIDKCFAEVDNWRQRGWKENEKIEEGSPKFAQKSVPRKPPTSTNRPITHTNADKLKAEAARRKQMIADARAKAKLQKEASSPVAEGLIVL